MYSAMRCVEQSLPASTAIQFVQLNIVLRYLVCSAIQCAPLYSVHSDSVVQLSSLLSCSVCSAFQQFNVFSFPVCSAINYVELLNALSFTM